MVSGPLKKSVGAAVLLPLLIAVSTLWSSDSAAQQPEWDPVAVARAHLAATGVQRGLAPAAPAGDQALVAVRESPGAVHVQLQQTLNGIPIDGAISTLSMQPGDQQVRFAIDKRHPDPASAAPAVPRVSQPAAEQAARNAIALVGQPMAAVTSSLVYVPRGLELRLAYEVRISARDPLGAWLVALDAMTGETISFNNIMAFDSGEVFHPNPAQSSGFTIPPPSNCDTPPNATALAGERTSVTLQGIAPAQNKLKGLYVDLTAPGLPAGYHAAGQANEASRVYNYNCNDDRFEEVMAYYYIDLTQRKIQALGFTGSSSVLASPVAVHPHWDAQCNAFYDPFSRGVFFMDGDVVNCSSDTGEDGDVIVHEYGHALQDAVTPGWGFSSNPLAVEQTGSIGEGWGDFIAGAMFGDPCTGGWALNEVYGGEDCLRTMDNTNVYPADFEACPDVPPSASEEVHCGGLLWGGALWDLVEAFGNDQAARDLVLRLVLDGQFYLSPLATFNDAAASIRQADVDLYGGRHAATINAVFAARGLNSTGTAGDTTYYFVRVRHTFVGDLELRLKVGSTTTPLCNVVIWPRGTGGSADDIMGWVPIASSGCAGFFPPTVAQPWYLSGSDNFPSDAGYIDTWAVTLSGNQYCYATDVPVNIPDGSDIAVASKVDCSAKKMGQPAVDPNDPDADGIVNAADNCPLAANPLQENSDSNFTDQTPPSTQDDRTWPNSDPTGDACDSDDDNDGILDVNEAAGCNASGPVLATNRDTDGDRFLDGAECAVGTNPASAGSKPTIAACAAFLGVATTVDTDGDRLRDHIEFCNYNTDRNDTDTDGDLDGLPATATSRDGCEAASFNQDRIVTSGDQLLLALEITREVTPSLRLVSMDINKDGVVSSGDQLLQVQFILNAGSCP
ncbi:MAG: M36 family metallopeptidase [Chloroflexi bacterium]|nr:M36 family metallopeptidase [Chloroflexota bacterium]